MVYIDNSRKYLILNEVLNAITHGVGFVLGVAGLVILIVSAAGTDEPIRIVAFSIYGSTLVLLYLFSCLYHSLTFTNAKSLFKIFDHSCIYLLIAGTYTPLCLVTLRGWQGWAIFGAIWGLALTGIVFKSIWMNKFKKLSTAVYIAMGWFCIIDIKAFYEGLGNKGFGLLLAGGTAFTIGAFFYSLKKIKFTHPLWHSFVVLGTVLMYFSILYYS